MRGIPRNSKKDLSNHLEALRLIQDLGLINSAEFQESKKKVTDLSAKEADQYSGRVLVVDDSKSICAEMKFFIERYGVEVHLAYDGQEALDILKKEPDFKIIFSDLNMPRVNGIELIKAAHADPLLKKIPFIMVTTDSGTSEIVQAKANGAVGWLVKPTSAGAVGALIKKFCPPK